jgi:hypothetical protein
MKNAVDELMTRFQGFSPGEQQRFLDALVRSSAVTHAGFAVVSAGFLRLIVRHMGGLVQMHASLLPLLTKHANRSWRIQRKADPADEELRCRHDEGGESYRAIGLDMGMNREAVRSAVRRARSAHRAKENAMAVCQRPLGTVKPPAKME